MMIVFMVSLVCVLYAYFLYPLFLIAISKYAKKEIKMNKKGDNQPAVTILMPVHNESNIIEAKLLNIDGLNYPKNLLNVVVVSDGSNDNTEVIVKDFKTDINLKIIVIEKQQGKANALNLGVKIIKTPIVIFTDASIMLDKESIHEIVAPFADDKVGCVSGEDHIPADKGGEGLYGKYELFLRNKESSIDSIVGASGSFYAQRLNLIKPFEEGLAPDFLSVLNTVSSGYRAVTEPNAIGEMGASKSTSNEYNRKVRTILRGMTALFSNIRLMNIFKYRWFSLFLVSHKLLRWMVPFFLISLLCSNFYLLEYPIFKLIFIGQVLFYILALASLLQISIIANTIIGKIPLFFTMVNFAILKAWLLLFVGKRQEIWSPTKRD